MSEFFVAGIPQPQGSKTAFVVKGRAVIVDKNPKLLKPWRAEIARVAKAAWVGDRLEGAVKVSAFFIFVRPASVRRALPHVRPDVDKLARAVLDGITDAGCVWTDDAQVVSLSTTKVYGDEPGVHVAITPMV